MGWLADGSASDVNGFWAERYLCKFGLVAAEEKATNAILCIDVVVIHYKSVPKIGQPNGPQSLLVSKLEAKRKHDECLTLCRAIWDDQL